MAWKRLRLKNLSDYTMRLFFLIIALLAPSLHAQQTPAANVLRLLCVGAAPQSQNLILAEKVGDAWLGKWRVSVADQSFSDPMAVASKTLCLAIDPSPPPANGGFTGPVSPIKEALEVQPLLTFSLPAGNAATAVLLPVGNAAANQPPYRVVVLNSSKSRFADGQVMLQNFTSSPVAGILGGRSVKLKPGGSAVVEPGIDQEADMAQVTLAREQEGQWVPFCDTRWPAKVDYRRYVLLLPRGDGGIFPFIMPEYQVQN